MSIKKQLDQIKNRISENVLEDIEEKKIILEILDIILATLEGYEQRLIKLEGAQNESKPIKPDGKSGV